jgi:hypothetical protein
VFDVEQLGAMARDFTVQARDATDPSDKSRLIKQAQSYLLLAKNADWIQSTDKFMHALRDNKRWPRPEASTTAPVA